MHRIVRKRFSRQPDRTLRAGYVLAERCLECAEAEAERLMPRMEAFSLSLTSGTGLGRSARAEVGFAELSEPLEPGTTGLRGGRLTLWLNIQRKLAGQRVVIRTVRTSVRVRSR